ncbi:MAG: transcription termination/antitermination protein NusA [Bdellovibrionaceae bacterium]|jgi:transcription termination/antitermination protein NusA|nr:transcription termination/antitermination protein NusA [Pseudobdellovibrionaceae bacterium]
MAEAFSGLAKVIEQMGKDKGIDRDLVVGAVVEGMLAAARKKYGTYREIEAQFNEETGEVELFEFLEVVNDEDFVDEEVEIKLTAALELDPDTQLNDSIGMKMEIDNADLGRIAAQTARQIITQKVRDAEKEIIFNEFEQRSGEVASGIARRVERRAIVVDLGRTEAFIPPKEQIPGETFRPGDRVQGFISEVRQTTRGPQIIMTRAGEQYLVKLFEQEVPEVYEGVVEVVSAAREPGARSKISVRTKDPAVDPVGACVGMKGSRVQNVVQELSGEKIDIVVWDEDPARFVCNALAPAEISKVFMDDEQREMEVIVPDHQLSLAIGRRGQNVRLASKLTGWRIDIVSESALAAKNSEAVFNLMLLADMTETMAQNIYQSGYSSFEELAHANVEHVKTIPGYSTDDSAEKLIKSASDLVEQYKTSGEDIPKAPEPEVYKPKEAQSVSKSDADKMLQEQLAQLNDAEAESGEASEDVKEAGADEQAAVASKAEASTEDSESSAVVD